MACSGDDDTSSDDDDDRRCRPSTPADTAGTAARNGGPGDDGRRPDDHRVAVHVRGDDPAHGPQHPPHHGRRFRQPRLRLRVCVRRGSSLLARRRRRPGQERGGQLLRCGHRRHVARAGPRVQGARPLRAGGRRPRSGRARSARRDRGLRGRLQPLSRRHRAPTPSTVTARGAVGPPDRRVRPRRVLQVAVVAGERRPAARATSRRPHRRRARRDRRHGTGVDEAAAGASAGEFGQAIASLVPDSGPARQQRLGDRSRSHRDGTTMLVGNPHFPWQGALRFYEAHLTVPDELDVYGVSLLGSPAINIGFTDGVAWSATVSAGRRFTAYTLDLVPGDPTRYRYGDDELAMTSRTVGVDVLADDGTTSDGRADVLVQPLRADHRLPRPRVDRCADAHVPRRQRRQRRVDPAVHGDEPGPSRWTT